MTLTFVSLQSGVLIIFNEKKALLNSYSVRDFAAKKVQTFGRYDSKFLSECGILAARFEPTSTKNLLNLPAVIFLPTMQVLSICKLLEKFSRQILDFSVFPFSFNIIFTFLELVLVVKLF